MTGYNVDMHSLFSGLTELVDFLGAVLRNPRLWICCGLTLTLGIGNSRRDDFYIVPWEYPLRFRLFFWGPETLDA